MNIRTRRGFLAAGLAHTAVVTLLLSGVKTAGASTGLATPEHWAKAAGVGPHMADLGRCCIEWGAAELDPRVLVARLNGALTARGLYPDDVSPAALRAALKELRRHEFLAGEVVRVDGWVLCRSEARGYALSVVAAARS